jgi:hypothetical protein
MIMQNSTGCGVSEYRINTKPFMTSHYFVMWLEFSYIYYIYSTYMHIYIYIYVYVFILYIHIYKSAFLISSF